MLVVSDSSTLILMAKSDLLDNAITFFGGITIPRAVALEVVEKGRMREDALLVKQRIINKKIKVEQTDERKRKELSINFNIDEGEAEAMALYMKLKAELLGIDDGKAIKVCKILGIKTFTCLSLLVFLAQIKAISVEEAKIKISALDRIAAYTKDNLFKALEKMGG